MNRREFFSAAGAITLGAGLLPTVPVFGGSTGVQPGTRPVRFRAKRVFLDSWTDCLTGVSGGIVRSDSPHAASFVRNQWNAVRNDGCNGLIFIPGRCSNAEWMKRIETEANRMELTVLVPSQLTRVFFDKAQTVVPLVQEEGIFQCCDGRRMNEGGFLLLNATDDVFGLVLYDASRCHWTGFVSLNAGLVKAGLVQNIEPCDQNPKLAVARWLDHARQSFS